MKNYQMYLVCLLVGICIWFGLTNRSGFTLLQTIPFDIVGMVFTSLIIKKLLK